jgi:hypothetical protein
MIVANVGGNLGISSVVLIVVAVVVVVVPGRMISTTFDVHSLHQTSRLGLSLNQM